MPWVRWLLLIAVAWTFAAGAAPRSAKKPKTTASQSEAAKRFGRGVGLYKDGDFEAALSEFKEAYRLAPHHEVLYNVGLTQRRLYLYGQAVKSLHSYLQQGGAAIPSARRELVEKELKEIRELTAEIELIVAGTEPAELAVDGEKLGKSPLAEPLLVRPGKHTFTATRGDAVASQTKEIVTGTRLVITLDPQLKTEEAGKLIINSEPPNAIVSVDGKLQGEAPVIITLPPGGHTVTADQDGFETTRVEVVLTGGQSRTVTVQLKPASGEQAVVGGPRRRVPLVGIVVTAGGAGLAAGAVIFNLQAQGAARQMSELFVSGGRYDGAAQAIESTGHRANALSWVMGLAAGAAITTGVIMMISTLISDPDAELSFYLGPTADGVALGWGTRW